jgi:Na+-transporting methylmalonyl-CoA/oxaloacetate decarboxylase gamma subunit
MNAVVGILFVVAYLGIIIYLISLLGRLVRAIERIATKIENSPKI